MEHPLYRRTDVPQFLLDIEAANPKNNDQHLPSALINLIKSVKVFGYFDQKIILEMCKYMETKTVYANNYLFKIGYKFIYVTLFFIFKLCLHLINGFNLLG